MTRCPYCLISSYDGAKFCSQCGEKVVTVQDPERSVFRHGLTWAAIAAAAALGAIFVTYINHRPMPVAEPVVEIDLSIPRVFVRALYDVSRKGTPQEWSKYLSADLVARGPDYVKAHFDRWRTVFTGLVDREANGDWDKVEFVLVETVNDGNNVSLSLRVNGQVYQQVDCMLENGVLRMAED